MESEEPLEKIVTTFCEKHNVSAPEVSTLLSAVEANDADQIWLALDQLDVPPGFYEELVSAIYNGFNKVVEKEPEVNKESSVGGSEHPSWDYVNSTIGSDSALFDTLDEEDLNELESAADVDKGINGEERDRPASDKADAEVFIDLPGFCCQEPTRNLRREVSVFSDDERKQRSEQAFEIRSLSDVLSSQSYFHGVESYTSLFTSQTNSPDYVEIAAAFGDAYEDWKTEHEKILIRVLRKLCRIQRVAKYLYDQPNDTSGAKDLSQKLVTVPDHELLMDCIDFDDDQWCEVADAYGEKHKLRSVNDLRCRFLNALAPWVHRSSWGREEDKRLKLVAGALGGRDWVLIARRLGTNRPPWACLIRYTQVISPQPIKKRWSNVEDEALKAAVGNLGEGRWQEVALCVGGFSFQQCLHRWRKLCVSSQTRKGRWSVEEVEALRKAVKAVGCKWAKVAQLVEGRNEVQCREKWVNCLDTGLRMTKWTEREDKILINCVKSFGVGKWSQIAKQLKGRTDNQCTRRWKQLCKAVSFSSRIEDV